MGHVDEHPYVKELLARIHEKAAEEDRVSVRGARAVDPEGLTAQEILRFLVVHGERTVPRLARDLNVALPTLRSYVSALARTRRVSLAENKRGATLIRYREDHAARTSRRRRSSKEPVPGPAQTAAEPV